MLGGGANLIESTGGGLDLVDCGNGAAVTGTAGFGETGCSEVAVGVAVLLKVGGLELASLSLRTGGRIN